MVKECTHKKGDAVVTPQGNTCTQCEKDGTKWVELRVCQTCGHVGCCDSSQMHARKHHEETGHPLIKPLEKKERDWTWCYVDDGYV